VANTQTSIPKVSGWDVRRLADSFMIFSSPYPTLCNLHSWKGDVV